MFVKRNYEDLTLDRGGRRDLVRCTSHADSSLFLHGTILSERATTSTSSWSRAIGSRAPTRRRRALRHPIRPLVPSTDLPPLCHPGIRLGSWESQGRGFGFRIVVDVVDVRFRLWEERSSETLHRWCIRTHERAYRATGRSLPWWSKENPCVAARGWKRGRMEGV